MSGVMFARPAPQTLSQIVGRFDAQDPVPSEEILRVFKNYGMQGLQLNLDFVKKIINVSGMNIEEMVRAQMCMEVGAEMSRHSGDEINSRKYVDAVQYIKDHMSKEQNLAGCYRI